MSISDNVWLRKEKVGESNVVVIVKKYVNNFHYSFILSLLVYMLLSLPTASYTAYFLIASVLGAGGQMKCYTKW